MTVPRDLSLDDPGVQHRVIEIARTAVAEAVADHHAAGRSVFYDRDGTLVEATPDGREIPLDRRTRDVERSNRRVEHRR